MRNTVQPAFATQSSLLPGSAGAATTEEQKKPEVPPLADQILSDEQTSEVERVIDQFVERLSQASKKDDLIKFRFKHRKKPK